SLFPNSSAVTSHNARERHDVVAGWIDNALDQRSERLEGMTQFIFVAVVIVHAAHAANGVTETALGGVGIVTGAAVTRRRGRLFLRQLRPGLYASGAGKPYSAFFWRPGTRQRGIPENAPTASAALPRGLPRRLSLDSAGPPRPQLKRASDSGIVAWETRS